MLTIKLPLWSDCFRAFAPPVKSIGSDWALLGSLGPTKTALLIWIQYISLAYSLYLLQEPFLLTL